MAKRNNLMCGVAPAALMLAASMTAQAHAADLFSPIPVAVSAPISNATAFQGFYIGGHVGYGSAEYTGIVSPGNGSPGTLDIEGFLVGGHAGYNWALMSNIIAGVEGDLSLTPWGGSKAHPDHDTQFVSGHLSGIASLRGRLGYTFDRTLLYATGGVAFASSNAVGGHTMHFNDRSRIAVGGVIGGGLEYMVSPNMSIRAEGLYYMFDEKQPSNGSGTGFSGIDESWIARVGASWYFDQASAFDPVAVDAAFQGFYIGGHVGYGSAEYTGIVGPAGPGGSPGKLEANGYLTGAHAGYNWQTMSNLIVGIEGDLSLTPWGGAKAHPDDSTHYVSGHLSGIASLRGRLGFAFDRTLLYATGGVAFASTNATGGETVQFNNRSKIATGGVVGGGIEFLTSENLAIRAEALYYMFDQTKQSGNGSASGFAGLNDAWVTRVGASWYFDQASDAEPLEADFRGFYTGGQVGYGSAEYSGIDSAGDPDPATFDAEGFLAGAHLGYNWETMSNLIVGIEGDVTLTPWGASDDPVADSEFVSGHLNGIATLRGRLGFAFDRSLIYATGGVAFASSNASGGGTLQFNSRTQIEVGPVAGGGIEYMATPNLSLRAEGLYAWFDQKQSGNFGSGYGGIQDTWMARVGASWHFN